MTAIALTSYRKLLLLLRCLGLGRLLCSLLDRRILATKAMRMAIFIDFGIEVPYG